MHYIAIRGQRVFLFVVGALVCITCYVGLVRRCREGEGVEETGVPSVVGAMGAWLVVVFDKKLAHC